MGEHAGANQHGSPSPTPSCTQAIEAGDFMEAQASDMAHLAASLGLELDDGGDLALVSCLGGGGG